MNGATPGTSTAQGPKPCVAKCCSERARERVALRAREQRREMLHDARVGVQRGERLAVLGPPLAQQQALGAQDRRAHGSATRSSDLPLRTESPTATASSRDDAGDVRADLVLHLHGLDDHEHLAGLDARRRRRPRRAGPCPASGSSTRSPPAPPALPARAPLGAAAALGREQLVGRQRDRDVVAGAVDLDRVVPLLGRRQRRLGRPGRRERVGELALDQPRAGLAGDERRMPRGSAGAAARAWARPRPRARRARAACAGARARDRCPRRTAWRSAGRRGRRPRRPPRRPSRRARPGPHGSW